MRRFIEFIKMVHRDETGLFGIDIAIVAMTAAISLAAQAAAAGAGAAGLTGVAASLTTAGTTVASAGTAASGFLGGAGAALSGATGLSGITQGVAAGGMQAIVPAVEMGAVGFEAMELGSLAVQGVSTAATAATSVYSGYAQARQAKAMGKAQQRMSEYNASLSDMQATGERQAGAADLRDARVRGAQIRERHRYLKGAQQAKLAKSGVVASEGTPLLVASEEAMRGKLDVMDKIWKGKMAKREHDTRAGYYESQAAGQRMEGAFAKKSANEQARSSILSGYISAGSSLMGGFASEYDMYNKYKGNNKMLSNQFGA